MERVRHKLQCRYVVNDNILRVNANLRRKIKRLEENGNSSVNNEEGREKSQKIEQLQYDLKIKDKKMQDLYKVLGDLRMEKENWQNNVNRSEKLDKEPLTDDAIKVLEN